MSFRVTFAFLREGNSDDSLVPVLEQLVVEAGADQAAGTALPYRGSSARKLSQLLESGPAYDLVFIHRDSDAPDPRPVRGEIVRAVEDLDVPAPVVCVVPVQEIEAWLLCDEAQIRRIAGFPNGRTPLNLPAIRNIERTSSPKEVLKGAYVRAATLSGARLKKHTARFELRRNALIEQIDIHGPVTELAAWAQLVDDINVAVGRLSNS